MPGADDATAAAALTDTFSVFALAWAIGTTVLVLGSLRLPLMVRHTSGFICTTITDDDAERLRLPPMAYLPGERGFAACTVTVDASSGVSTGISARDRALTLRLLADPGTS
ncbi:MAG: 3,4-dihydroxy-2-butanone-4-phosphate synthase, partial [Thermocrispum sp.]